MYESTKADGAESLRAGVIKKAARSHLRPGAYWPFAGAAAMLQVFAALPFVLLFATTVLAGIVLACLRADGLTAFLFMMTLTMALSVPVLYVWGYTSFGATRLALAAARGRFSFREAFSGKGNAWKMLWLALARATYVQLWLLVLIVPGIVKSLAYSFSPYLQADHPGWTAGECITESRRLADGCKWRIFVLELSFFGWYLLLVPAAFLPGGMLLGGAALEPYVSTAFAELYLRRLRSCGPRPMASLHANL